MVKERNNNVSSSKRQRCDREREQSESQSVSFKDKRDMMRMIKNRVYDRVREMRVSLCKDKRYGDEGERDENERDSDRRGKIGMRY